MPSPHETPSNHSGIEVVLSAEELRLAAQLGADRQHESFSSNRKNKHDWNDGQSELAVHVEGVAGEIAAAKALGLYYEPRTNTFKDADLGSRTQVRTRSAHNYDLIVRKDDSDDHIFILVTGSAPRFFVRGWMQGGEAKQKQWIRRHGNREAAYFIHASDLRDITELIA